MIQIPEILDLPDKLLPMVFSLNDFSYFLAEGGRGSGKSHSIARIILWICEQRNVRVVCGREIQKSITQSVYNLFKDLVVNYGLDFTLESSKITHNRTGSVISFMGFREQGRVNIKGLEGVDILWIDEAESITKPTLDTIIPTIRKDNALVFFSMNRYVRNDPIYVFCAGRKDCLHIKINYYDNKHCPEKIKREAEELKIKNYRDYKHIYLGEPLDQTIDYLFSSAKLEKAESIVAHNEHFKKLSVMSVDLGAGGDLCVAKKVAAIDNSKFEEVETLTWSERDTDITIGKVIALKAKWQPDLVIVDGGGLGLPMYNTMSKSIEDLIKFDGAGATRQENASNQRADGYFCLKDLIDSEFLKINDNKAIAQLEYIKIIYQRNGKILIQDKKEMKAEHGESPDNADSLMMAAYALTYYSHLADKSSGNSATVMMDDTYDPFEN